MKKKIKNFELVTLALYSCGGSSEYIGTEDIAIEADKKDNTRFKWKKYKEYIDRGLIFDCLKTAKNRKLGPYLKGNDEKGWMLTQEGLNFCQTTKDFFKLEFRKKRIGKIEKNYIIREEFRIKSTKAFNKFYNNNKSEISREDIKDLFKIDDYTTKENIEKRTLGLLENFKDNNYIYELINTYQDQALELVVK